MILKYIFIINDINNYILYIPITRGIKTYISDYLIIITNIHSIEIYGDFNEESEKDLFIFSYLLIHLL